MEGIKPIWETPEHSEGGCWNIRINKGYANRIWEDLLLAFIGEQFDCCNEVTGLVLSIGDRQDKISIWMRHGLDHDIKDRVKQDLIRLCELPLDIRLDYLTFFPPGKANVTKGEDNKPKYAERELKPVVL